jgi:hypothetical protein
MLSVAVALPFLHNANESLFLFHPDVVNFAAAPWLLILALWLDERSASPRMPAVLIWLCAGLAFGITYVLKYSLVFVGLGALVFLAIGQWRLWSGSDRGTVYASRRLLVRGGSLAIVAVGFAIPILTLSYLNSHFSGALNSASQRLGFSPRWESLVALIANPALAPADADGLWRFVLLHPSHPLLRDAFAPAYLGFPFGLVAIWLLAHAVRMPSLRRSLPAHLAVATLLISLATLGALWTFTNDAADFMPRHVAPASLAVLPVLFLSGRDIWNRRARGIRLMLIATAMAVVVIPAAYGAISVLGKLTRVPATYRRGPADVYNPLLASADLSAVEHQILRDYAPTTDVWYAADAITAFDLPGRVISFDNVDSYPLKELRQLRFHTSQRLRVTMLIPPHFETDGKGPVIRGEFLGAGPWTHATVPGSNYDVWTTVVDPMSTER